MKTPCPINKSPSWNPPWPQSPALDANSVGRWRAAEARLGRALADAATEYARMDERIRSGGPGLLRRLAFAEIAEISWAAGQRITADRLALYDALGVARGRADARDFTLAHWAFRRMVGTLGPLEDGLPAFLGRTVRDEDVLGALAPRPGGDAFAEAADFWTDEMKRADLHPLSLGAFGLALWRGLQLSAPGDVFEAGVVAARLGASGSVPFLPIGFGDARIYGLGGTEEERLLRWYCAISGGAARARMLLDEVSRWQERARAGVAGLSGRTPPQLVGALVETPALSAEMAAAMIGCTRATALRNLTAFEAAGLVREITGQGRFRFWAALL